MPEVEEKVDAKTTTAEKLQRMLELVESIRDHVDPDAFFDAILDVGERALKVVSDGKITWTEALGLGVMVLQKVNQARK